MRLQSVYSVPMVCLQRCYSVFVVCYGECIDSVFRLSSILCAISDMYSVQKDTIYGYSFMDLARMLLYSVVHKEHGRSRVLTCAQTFASAICFDVCVIIIIIIHLFIYLLFIIYY